MEIRLKYINQDSFYGSDYFIKRVGYEEKWDRVKRLGDTYYENELLERSVTEKYGSNLKIGKVDNTAAAIGATGNGKLSIDEYVGHNLENVDKSKTVGGSVGISTSGINSIGINYNDRKQEGITKNTVIGNVEIGKSSGAEINKDLDSMTEITKDRKFETNVNIESQTIRYALNPEAFKQDLKKAKNEIEDIGNVIENTVNPPGEDKRNFFKNLRAQRWNTSFYNVTGSRMEELSRQFKAGEINANQLKKAVRELAKGYGKDIGIEYEVVYLDEETMPEDAKGSTGAAYKAENGKILIPIDVSKIEDINQLLGTLTEEISHGKDALEGRQDKKVAEDKSNDEKGLESLGRPANDYVKNKLGEDNNSKIKLSTDGIDLTNANVGEKVGDVITSEDRKEKARLQAERPINKKIKKAMEEFKNSGRAEQVSSGFIDMIIGGGTAAGGFSLMVGTGSVDFATSGSTFVFTLAPKAVGVTGMTTGGSRFWVGTKKVWNGLFGEKVEYQTHPIRDSKLFKGNEEFYDLIEITTGGIVAYFGQVYPTTNTNKENLENAQAKGSKETVKVEQKQGQNPQQGQRSQDNIAQNNKNSINKTQAQESQNNPSNQQVSKGATSNNQQGAPISKTSDVNKLEVSKGSSDTTQKVVSTVSNNNKVGNLIFYAEENGEVKVIDKLNDTGKIAKNTKGMKPMKKEQALEDIFTKEQEILKTSNPNIGVKDINKNGIKIKYDKEKYIKQIEDIKLGDLNGKKTENLVDDILNDFTKKNPDFEIIDAKYGSDNGIDHMLKNKKTGELWILDSKQMSEKSITYEGGAVKLSKDGAGGNIQLSSEWVNSVAGKKTLNETAKKELEKAIKTQNYKTGIVALDKKTGDLIVAPIEITPKKSKK
ncbi:hypothetical protein [Fusobacterium canifelinum]|uniref:hypothetical protein n=1 Tax=Fusobacterium canifelinum TaxID=285729 RepID=UPI001E537A19|nr:hypothetical protein [Fusobacterium canifelinum]